MVWLYNFIFHVLRFQSTQEKHVCVLCVEFRFLQVIGKFSWMLCACFHLYDFLVSIMLGIDFVAHNNGDVNIIHFSIKNLHYFHVIIQTLNTTFLCNNMKTSIMTTTFECLTPYVLQKQKICHKSIDVHKLINASKYSYVSIHDDHGLIMIFDMHMHLNSFDTTISHGS